MYLVKIIFPNEFSKTEETEKYSHKIMIIFLEPLCCTNRTIAIKPNGILFNILKVFFWEN